MTDITTDGDPHTTPRAEDKALPEHGLPAAEILEILAGLRRHDVQWGAGKVFSLVFHAGQELTDLLKQAHGLYFAENALNPTAFPSLRKLETEVVAMTARLLGGDETTVGTMTSGGTESILLAVKAARDRGMARGKVRGKPEMVLPASAHPAFDKAAHYFRLKAVHIPVGGDLRADVAAMRRAITRRTVLLVGSAPSYPHGVVDPIVDLAALAREHHLPLHVDACVGGFMLPFVRELGYEVPPFDFRVPGVSSISVDLHKYGYAAKGASVILYRNPRLRRHQFFACTDWPGGIYASPTMTGTRPGGAIAAAWAILHRLGHRGYLGIAKEVMEATRRIQAGVEEIEGIRVLGKPHMSLMALTADHVDIYEVADHLGERGWHLDRQQRPPSLHLTVNRAHVPSVGIFLEDLREAVAASRKEPLHRLLDRSKLALAGTVSRVLPTAVARRAAARAADLMGGDGLLPRRTAAMYGMMASLPNRGDLRELVLDVLDRLTRPDNA